MDNYYNILKFAFPTNHREMLELFKRYDAVTLDTAVWINNMPMLRGVVQQLFVPCDVSALVWP